MEQLQSITQVAKTYGVSARMLRYYEQAGLLRSTRKEGYSYRVYDEENCRRIAQILILRKLRIPVKQIYVLLNSNDLRRIIEVFQKNIREREDDIHSLSTIRSILTGFIEELQSRTDIRLKETLLEDTALLSILETLPPVKTTLKEENNMEALEKADSRLAKLSDRDVRIVYLPPATVASYQYEGEDPEYHVGQVVIRFVRESGLAETYPALRQFGFNCPNPVDESGRHGYEMWVTIPDNMEVPEPLVKKSFPGGQFAAHMIPMGAFEEWGWLDEWVKNNGRYEYRGDGDYRNMFGSLEEHLDFIHHVRQDNPEPEGMQLDLLIPVREKQN